MQVFIYETGFVKPISQEPDRLWWKLITFTIVDSFLLINDYSVFLMYLVNSQFKV